MAHPATTHFSIIDVTITDEFIERRSKAATAISARWRKLSSATVALEKASMLAEALVEASNGGSIPAGLRHEVGEEIKRAAPTHDPADQSKDFEIAVTAAVAAIMMLESAASRTEHCNVFAEALSAAMDISVTKGAPRMAALWEDLSRAARLLGDGTAEARRSRFPVDTSDPALAVQNLADNALRDQEEIDLLWWTLGDWSVLGASRLSTMPMVDGTVAAAVELTNQLRWPAVRALRQLAHRNVRDHEQQVTLEGLAIADQDLRAKLDIALAPMFQLVSGHPQVFVALGAIIFPAPRDALAQTGIDRTLTKPAWGWTERIVRELSLAKSAGGKLGPIE